MFLHDCLDKKPFPQHRQNLLHEKKNWHCKKMVVTAIKTPWTPPPPLGQKVNWFIFSFPSEVQESSITKGVDVSGSAKTIHFPSWLLVTTFTGIWFLGPCKERWKEKKRAPGDIPRGIFWHKWLDSSCWQKSINIVVEPSVALVTLLVLDDVIVERKCLLPINISSSSRYHDTSVIWALLLQTQKLLLQLTYKPN